MSWVRALLAGLSSYLLVGIGIVFSAPPFPLVAVMVVVAVALAPLAFPRLTQSIGAAASTSAESIARMLAGGLLTGSVTHLSPLLGPKFRRLFAVFPGLGIVLAAVSHRASSRQCPTPHL